MSSYFVQVIALAKFGFELNQSVTAALRFPVLIIVARPLAEVCTL